MAIGVRPVSLHSLREIVAQSRHLHSGLVREREHGRQRPHATKCRLPIGHRLDANIAALSSSVDCVREYLRRLRAIRQALRHDVIRQQVAIVKAAFFRDKARSVMSKGRPSEIKADGRVCQIARHGRRRDGRRLLIDATEESVTHEIYAARANFRPQQTHITASKFNAHHFDSSLAISLELSDLMQQGARLVPGSGQRRRQNVTVNPEIT